MKKVFVLLVVIVSLSISAQEHKTDINMMQSSVSLEWDKPKGENNIIRLDAVYKHIVVGGSYIIGSGEGEGYDASKGFDVHVGGNYRYFLGNGLFYIEGRLLVGYQCMTQKMRTGVQTVRYHSGFGNRETIREEQSEIWKTVRAYEGFNLGLTPRIGIQKNGYSLYAGAGWNFLASDVKLKEVKFDDKFEGYFFTIGLAKLF